VEGLFLSSEKCLIVIVPTRFIPFVSCCLMRPRDFVVKKDALLQNCVYSVIPVVNNRFLDLPYHLNRLHRSFSLFEENDSYFDTEIFNQLVADSCLKSMSSTEASNGLLTVCIGSDVSVKNGILSSSSIPKMAADSLFFKMPEDFLFAEKNDLIVDLHEDIRSRDRRIKASCWPLERTNIENNRPKQVIETVLYKAQNSAIYGSPATADRTDQVKTGNGVDNELPNNLQLTEGRRRHPTSSHHCRFESHILI
jgi:hypothetical protein